MHRIPGGGTKKEQAPRACLRRLRWLGPGMAFLLVVGLVAGCEGEPSQRPGESPTGLLPYEFIRGIDFYRIDTRSGEVSRATLDGATGWRPVGDAPQPAGGAAGVGRYHLSFIPAARLKSAKARLVRSDSVGGRAWLLEVLPNGEVALPWRLMPGALPPQSSLGARVARDPVSAPDSTRDERERPPASALARNRPTPSRAALEEAGLWSGEGRRPDPHALRDALGRELPTELRIWVVDRLGDLEPAIATPLLIDALWDDEAEVAAAALEQLYRSAPGDERALSALREAGRSHPAPDVRTRARELAPGAS